MAVSNISPTSKGKPIETMETIGLFMYTDEYNRI